MSRFVGTSLLTVLLIQSAPAGEPLAGTQRLTANGDLAAAMVAGIDRFLLVKTAESIGKRSRHWQRDPSSPEKHARSVEPNRQRLRKIIGSVDPVLAGPIEMNGSPADFIVDDVTVSFVRWPVYDVAGAWTVNGYAVKLAPQDAKSKSVVIALPDADVAPIQFAGLSGETGIPLRLAQAGCTVFVPWLVDRSDRFSLVAGQRRTNQPAREFVYRQAYEMGRHLIGYEVDMVRALVGAVEQREPGARVAVFGYGEGGLVALYAAACDPRISAACVSGYFDNRQNLWQEPIYRNVWSLLDEFGDAEIASLVAPRPLVIEACSVPKVDGPPQANDGFKGAAPGRLVTPSLATVQAEAARARKLVDGLSPSPVIEVVASGAGSGPAGSDEALSRFLQVMGVKTPLSARSKLPLRDFADDAALARRTNELIEYTQHLLREGEKRRGELWKQADAASLDAWRSSTAPLREYFANEVIGRFDDQRLPPAPRSRLVYDEPTYRGYEVMLDVFPEVFAYGILLVPKDLKPGERRPVVVCQHGLEGRPSDVADPRQDNPAYHRYACRLADEGFIAYAPQNPYIGEDKFRTLQRQANPLKKSLFSIIVPQHQAAVDWLASLPMVDPERIAFYGLSYGGKTAMRVPALVEKYCLSICSADFNEWIWKNVSNASRYSYLGTGEYEMVEFDLGNTFNYAEMAALIAPRPFMVERGHHDGVAPDEWVAYEYAKVRRLYAGLKIPDRTTIEFFDGPHTINGVGTFQFLREKLNWK